MISEFFCVMWLTAYYYAGLIVTGKIAHFLNLRKLGRRERVDKIIFQLPTIGNVKTTNKIFETLRGYDISVDYECWVVIEEWDKHKGEYNADRTIVVPKSFECEDLYKARALECARQVRQKLISRKQLENNYIVIQLDDDSVISKEYINDCLTMNADVMIATIVPKPNKFWLMVLDYARPIACGTFCKTFNNIKIPIWGHGEGLCINSQVDKNISYDITDMNPESNYKIISSEDQFYLHKAVINGYTSYSSAKPVYIDSPLTFRDAIRQRRRWSWGHINTIRHRLLPRFSLMRILYGEASGKIIYPLATLAIPLHFFGLISMPKVMYPFLWFSLVLWLGSRGYLLAKTMGWKHGILGLFMSFFTVTLGFIVGMIGIFQGDPKKFEVIEKR